MCIHGYFVSVIHGYLVCIKHGYLDCVKHGHLVCNLHDQYTHFFKYFFILLYFIYLNTIVFI